MVGAGKARYLHIGAVLVVGLCSAAANAAPPYADFLHALQRRGYGELAIEYLEKIKNNPDLPAELRDEFDLEMYNSLDAAAQEAATPELKQQRLESAKARMDAFLKAHPNHPGVAAALMSGANEPYERGQRLLARAEVTFDSATKDKLLADAREALEQARPILEKALGSFRAKLTEVEKIPVPSDKEKEARKRWAEQRAAAKRAVMEAVYRLGGLDYAVAQTYGPKDPNRNKNLEIAAKSFYTVYSAAGGFESKMGLMWNGRCTAELGDLELALDMYDEAQGGEPTDGNIPADVADFYGQIEQYKIQALHKRKGAKAALDEGAEWQKSHAAWKKFNAWHAVQLELAKVHLAQAAKTPASKQQALKILDEIIKSGSDLKGAAMVAKRQAEGAATEASADERLEGVRSATAAGKYSEAIEGYEKILEKWPADKDAKVRAEVAKELTQTRYRLATKQFTEKQFREAIAQADKIVQADPKDPLAVTASVLSVFCRAQLYEAAPKDAQAEAFKELQAAADDTIKRFPDKPEAEEAKLAVAGVYLKQQDFDHALPIYEQIKPESRRYGASLEVASQIYLQRYLDERKKPEKDRNVEAMKALRDKAIEKMQISVNWQKQKIDPRDAMPASVRNSQLQLANLFMEAKQPDKAATLLEPLVADAVKQGAEKLDGPTLGVYLVAVRAYAELNNTTKATEIANKLLSGPDTESVNGALIEFLKLLDKEVKGAEAARNEAETQNDPTVKTKAKQKYDATKAMWEQLVSQIAARKNHSIPGTLYLVDTCNAAGFAQTSSKLLQGFVEKTKSDAKFAKLATPFMTRVNTQLISALRASRDYEQALDRVDALIKDHPDALEPKVERARILQDWAAGKDPKKYPEATKQWTEVRMALGTLKPKSDEYFESIINVSDCLYADAKVTNDKKKLLQALQVLKGTLVQTPELSGQAMVKRYEDKIRILDAANKAG